MLRRVRRFLSLPGGERALFVRAWTQLALTGAALRLAGVRPASRVADQLNARRPDAPADDEAGRVRRTVEIVTSASRLGPTGTCLTRSLVLRGLLRRQGIDSTLRMGVRRGDETHGVEGHAWVEVDGVPINDAADVAERYVPLPDDPGV